MKGGEAYFFVHARFAAGRLAGQADPAPLRFRRKAVHLLIKCVKNIKTRILTR
jgi:hypothetical protein